MECPAFVVPLGCCWRPHRLLALGGGAWFIETASPVLTVVVLALLTGFALRIKPCRLSQPSGDDASRLASNWAATGMISSPEVATFASR